MDHEALTTLIFLLINTMIAVLYIVIQSVRKKGNFVVFRGLLMILCPGTGILIYGCSYLIGLLFPKEEVNYSEISMSKERKNFLQVLDKEKESEVLPLEEVLTVSTPKERRKAMMNLLKMDMSKNLGLLRKAVENEDVETSHYAASALTDRMGKFSVQFQEYQMAYDNDHSVYEPCRKYFDAVAELLATDALVGEEKRKYQYTLVQLAENMTKYHITEMTGEDYQKAVQCYCDLGRIKEAAKFAELGLKFYPEEEKSFLGILYIAYKSENSALFEEALKQLKASRLPLSKDGLAIVRYWSQHLGNAKKA